MVTSVSVYWWTTPHTSLLTLHVVDCGDGLGFSTVEKYAVFHGVRTNTDYPAVRPYVAIHIIGVVSFSQVIRFSVSFIKYLCMCFAFEKLFAAVLIAASLASLAVSLLAY